MGLCRGETEVTDSFVRRFPAVIDGWRCFSKRAYRWRSCTLSRREKMPVRTASNKFARYQLFFENLLVTLQTAQFGQSLVELRVQLAELRLFLLHLPADVALLSFQLAFLVQHGLQFSLFVTIFDR